MATVRDLKLDETTGDIAIEDGDIVLIEDLDVVAQHIRIRLRTILGEWYLDTSKGVDWFGVVFSKEFPRGMAEATLRNAIETVDHVRALAKFEATFDGTTRHLSIEFEASTDFGTVTMLVESP
ncbi:MAG: hypothetical protein V2A73_16090 [Pseudomonadota bacterium]